MTPTELKIWRLDNDYSQSQLAKALGVITMTISRWERGTREIPPYLHLALKYLKVRRSKTKAGRKSSKNKGKETNK